MTSTLAALSVVDKVYFPNHNRYLPQSRLNALELYRVLDVDEYKWHLANFRFAVGMSGWGDHVRSNFDVTPHAQDIGFELFDNDYSIKYQENDSDYDGELDSVVLVLGRNNPAGPRYRYVDEDLDGLLETMEIVE